MELEEYRSLDPYSLCAGLLLDVNTALVGIFSMLTRIPPNNDGDKDWKASAVEAQHTASTSRAAAEERLEEESDMMEL